MSVRRLASAEIQPPSFAFSAENAVWAGRQIAKYPDGRQASAVIPLLWRAQHQAGGWVPQKAIEHVAEVLGMAYIRVLEIATFYTMFNLAPVGRHFVQLCGTTPCMLRGAQELRKQLVARIGPEKTVSADGKFSWAEVECLGACCNAPMVQINDDFYEDLTPESLDKLLDDLAAGRPVKIGPQNGRVSSEPEGAITTLTDTTLYDGSVVGAWRARFEQEEKAKAEAAAAAAAHADAAKAPPAAPAAAQAAAAAPAQPAAPAASAGADTRATAAAAAQTPEPGKPATTRPEQQASDSPAARTAEGQTPTAPATAHAASAATAPDQQERAGATPTASSSAAASSAATPPASASAGSSSAASSSGAAGSGSSITAAAPQASAAGSAAASAAQSPSGPGGSAASAAAATAGGSSALDNRLAAVPSAAPEPVGSSTQAGVASRDSGPAAAGMRAVAYVNWEPEFTGPAVRLSSAGGGHFAGEAIAARPSSSAAAAGGQAAAAPAQSRIWTPAGPSQWEPAFTGGPAAPMAAQISDGDKPELLDMPRGDGPDDLKLIWGVGPKLEAMLHRLGVFHFDQIAGWTEPNLHWVDQHLEAFKGRAVRERWVEQAKKLATGWRPQGDISDKPKG